MNINTIKEAIERAWAEVQPRKGLLDLQMLAAPELTKLFPKFEQIAFYTPDMAKTMADYRKLGCIDWTEDIVTAQGTIGDTRKPKSQRVEDAINVAHLAFNYQLGTELELIRYKAGMNWHLDQGRIETDGSCREPFLSHMSYHVESITAEQTRLERAGFNVIQSVRTLTHTSPYLIEKGRLYFYTIFNTRALLGFDVKLIERRPK